MPYNFDNFQSQLADLSRQYQQLQNQSQPVNPQYIPQPIPQPIPSRQVQYVDGYAGAKLYQQNLPPNSSEIIMDKNENILYLVSKDANGTPSKQIPHGHFTIEEDSEEEPIFLTRKDFDDFKDEIRKMLATHPTKTPTKTEASK